MQGIPHQCLSLAQTYLDANGEQSSHWNLLLDQISLLHPHPPLISPSDEEPVQFLLYIPGPDR